MNFKLQLNQLRTLLQSGQIESAEAKCAELKEQHPDNLRLDIIQCRIHFRQGRLTEAQDVLTYLKQSNAPVRQITELDYEIAEAIGDRAQKKQALLSYAALPDMRPRFWLYLAELFWEENDRAKAVEALKSYFVGRSDPEKPKADIGPVSQFRWDILDDLMPAIGHDLPDNAAAQETLFFVEASHGRFDAAINVLVKARSLAPANSLKLSAFDSAGMPPINWTAFLEPLLVRLQNHTDIPELIWLSIRILRSTGRLEEALILGETNKTLLRSQPPPQYVDMNLILQLDLLAESDNPKVKLNDGNIIKLAVKQDRWEEARDQVQDPDMRAFLDEAIELRARIQDRLPPPDIRVEIVFSGSDRSNGVVIFFSGLGDAASVPISIIDVFFAELGLNVIYCRDVQRLLFCKGLKSLGLDFRSTIEALRNMLEISYSGKPVYTMGNSAGGFAAMVYGAELGAASSIVFSPLGTVDPEQAEIMGDFRARILAHRMRNHIRSEDFILSDFITRAAPGYRITAYAPSDRDLDALHGHLLEEIPNVTVIWLEGYGSHDTAKYCARKFGMLNIIRAGFGLPASS